MNEDEESFVSNESDGQNGSSDDDNEQQVYGGRSLNLLPNPCHLSDANNAFLHPTLPV